MSDLRLDDYAVGDIVQMVRTGKVSRITDNYIEFEDVTSGRFGIDVRYNAGSTRVEMVKRAARPRPEQGTVLTGKQVADWWWKRGTIFQLVESGDGRELEGFAGLVLRADGLLYDLDHDGPGVAFDYLNQTAKFELRFVA